LSIRSMTWAFAQPLSGNEKVVLLALADFANDDGECWPSIPKIAEKAYLSVRTVQRIVATLSDQGYMAFERRASQAGGSIESKYRLFVNGANLSPPGDKKGGGGDTVVISYKDEPSLRTVNNINNRGSRIPELFTPDDSCHAKAVSLGLLITAEIVDAFIDYWRGVPGAKGVKLDWQATFRNQLRHIRKSNGVHHGNKFDKPSILERFIQDSHARGLGQSDSDIEL